MAHLDIKLMYIATPIIHCLFPLIALILLIIGFRKKTIYYVTSSLWLCVIALIIHYQSSGGEILGDYFNYINAAIYSSNLIILFISLSYIITNLSSETIFFKYFNPFLQSLMVLGCLLVLMNLWINAFFIENRLEGTPIIQVALVHKPDYCSSKHLFYKINTQGSVNYLCPNYYGLIPAIGSLDLSPDFIVNQLSMPNKQRMLLLQKNHS